MTNYCEALREVSASRARCPRARATRATSTRTSPRSTRGRARSRDPRARSRRSPSSRCRTTTSRTRSPTSPATSPRGRSSSTASSSSAAPIPAISVLPSLSRLMKDGIGEGMTRDDHKELSSQLFAAYARTKSVRNLAAIIGEEELSPLDKRYLRFGERFESEFVSQAEDEDRSIEQTLDLGWKLLSLLPKEELVRVSRQMLEKYLPKEGGDADANVAPTKSNLLREKETLALAEEGYDLLEQKREILMLELMKRIDEMKVLDREMRRRAGTRLSGAQADAPRGGPGQRARARLGRQGRLRGEGAAGPGLGHIDAGPGGGGARAPTPVLLHELLRRLGRDRGRVLRPARAHRRDGRPRAPSCGGSRRRCARLRGGSTPSRRW